MPDLLVVIGLGVALFVTTNIDDIFVLVTFFADPSFRPRQIVIGQFLGIGALVALSVVGSLLALVAPGEYIGLLGLIPFALGVWKLVKLLRHTEEDAAPARGGSRILSVAFVTFANGGDNIGAYVPVFATQSPIDLVVTIVMFLVMTAVWCLIGYSLVNHPRVGPAIRRVAAPLTSFVLMAIGVLIVLESGAYRLVFG